MLLMMSSMMLNAATDSDELASIAPEEGCYASLRDYLFKKKTMFDDTDVMGGDEGDQGDQEPEEPEVQEPEDSEDETPTEDTSDAEVAPSEDDTDTEVAPDVTNDAEVAPEKEEPEVAPEGVLGVDDDGSMSGPAPVISPEEQAAIDEAEQNPDVALILQNFEDEDDFDEEALIGSLLGAGVAAGLAALLAKKFMDMKKKKQAGNVTVDGQPKVTADDKTLNRVQSGKIGTTDDLTPKRPVSVRPVSVTDLPESNLRPGGTAEVVKSDKPGLLKDNAKAIGKELKGLNEKGIVKPSDVAKATKYQRQAAAQTPLPAGAKDPLAALRARLAEKGQQGLPLAVDKEPSPLEKALAKQKAKVDAAAPPLPRRALAADDAEQARLKTLAAENAKKKAARKTPKPARKFVGKYGVKG